MARLFVSPERVQGARATLDESAHRHLVKVLRLGPGAAIRLFDGQGTEIEARIEAVGRASVDVVLGERHRVPGPACAITLLQAVPRGERMDFIVQKTTELGVMRIVPVLVEHGMVKPAADRTRRWQTIAEEAARQCERADVPRISESVPLADAIAEMAGYSGSRFMLWEGEKMLPFRQALAAGPRQVALLVGPEGGFAQSEVATCASAGFQAAGLGPRILRSETAAIVAVALAQAFAGGLD
jgi:16S rRNA (uracil1498-N3)-methyltransferase